jgi:SAM-dependent methyltransferase
MHYFKHSELVTRYHISLKTVHNWIDAAKQKKIDLHLYEYNNRTYIANIPDNVTIIERLASKGKKYRNTLHQKVVSPKPEFYELYNPRQILDIISNINLYGEIPRQYNYFGEGAVSWDKWLQRLLDETTPNMLNNTIELIHHNIEAIDFLIGDRTRVNVIDIGVGNAQPVRELLTHLLEQGKLNRYIGIDISQKMLDIAEANIKEWFGDKIKFEGHIRDASYEHFDDLLVNDMLGSDAEKTVNIALLLGITRENFRSPMDILRAISDSIAKDDLFIFTTKPDSEVSRQYFDFGVPGSTGLSPKYKYILDLLNIDESLYETEMGYSEQKRMRYVRVRLKAAISINFSFEGSERAVQLEKGDTILLLRIWHMSELEIITDFEEVSLKLLQASMTKDRQYLLTISGVEAKQELKAA